MSLLVSEPTTIGILGAGQLGLMTAQAAHKRGFRVCMYAPEGDNPGFREADATIVGPFDSQVHLQQFANLLGDCSITTFESENMPGLTLYALQQRGRAVAPSLNLLRVAQDRLLEKNLARQLGIATVPYADMDELVKTRRFDGLLPGLVKTRKGGYDGKGQMFVETPQEAIDAWKLLGSSILERKMDIAYELSVIIAYNHRGPRAYPAVVNEHEDGILQETRYEPGLIPADIELQAKKRTFRLARYFNLEGLLVGEYFVTKDGQLLFNEMAPRPHNSGHWTIEGCKVSQFDNFVRAICGEELLDPSPLGPALMVNLIGSGALLADHHRTNGAAVHVYGKKEMREGRKMGHVTYWGAYYPAIQLRLAV